MTQDAGLAELRFFRDLVDAERMKVFKVFDLLPQDDDEQLPHAIQRKLFYAIFTRQAASQGSAGGERSAKAAAPKHDHLVYFGCESCEEHAPENGVNCREDIGVMPDGTWLCDGCYSDCDKSAYGMVASDVDDFELPRFEDLPRPEPYGTSPLPSAEGK